MYRGGTFYVFLIACVSSSVVPATDLPGIRILAPAPCSSRRIAIGRSGGSKSCSVSVDEPAFDQATDGLVEEDVGVVVEPGQKLFHQLARFVLGSACEPELRAC